MAITYTMPDGTVVTTIAQAANHLFNVREGRATPTNAEVVIMADRKPGTPIS
jgi:hypothetical protein